MDNQKLSVKPRKGYGFIYCYTSPSGKKYIGKTKTTLKERAKNNAKGYKGCRAFYNAIQKYGWENFEVEILEEVLLENLDDAEVEYILKYDSSNKEKGYNIVTERQEFIKIFNQIPVYSYDCDTGNFIEEFESVTEAERKMSVYRGSIRRVLNDPKHRVKNRLWKTEKFDKIEVVLNNIQKTSKNVYVYDAKTGDFIKSFSSVRETSRETGYNRSTIQEQLQKEKVTKAKKHIFKYFKVDNLFNESSTTIPEGSKLKQAETETTLNNVKI